MIDRNNLVARHRIRLTQPDARSPLSLDNGEFAFTTDITGLQIFPEFHQQSMQLGAQAPRTDQPAGAWLFQNPQEFGEAKPPQDLSFPAGCGGEAATTSGK